MKTIRVVFSYLVLTLIAFAPLVAVIDTHVIGAPDAWQNLWNIWWMGKSLSDWTSPYHTNMLFYPTGASLGLHTLSPLNSLTGALLSPHLGLIASYNIIYLAHFILACTGVYLLAYHLSRNTYASFTAGIVYGFSTYHYLETLQAHVNMASIGFTPLYALALLKMLDGKGKLFAPGFLLFLTGAASFQHYANTILFTLFVLAYYKRTGKLKPGKTRQVAFTVILSLLLLSPLAYPAVHDYLTTDSGTRWSAIYHSTDLADFIKPNPYNMLKPYPSAGTAPIGIVLLAILSYSFFRDKSIRAWMAKKKEIIKKYSNITRRSLVLVIFSMLSMYTILGLLLDGRFMNLLISIACVAAALILYELLKENTLDMWKACALLFFTLSLGPFLKINGTPYFPLPYLLISASSMDVFNTPHRFTLFFSLAAAVITAKVLSRTTNKTILLAGLLIFLESLSILSLAPAGIPPAYTIISQDPGEYAILDVPIPPIIQHRGGYDFEHGLSEYMYYQSMHGKRIVGGDISRDPVQAIRFLNETRPFKDIRQPESITGTIDPIVLSGYRIKYVIIHKGKLTEYYPGSPPRLEEYFRPLKKMTEDEDTTLYRVY